MHAGLDTDRATIATTVKYFADAIRHGHWVESPTPDRRMRWQMLLLARNILLEFLDVESPMQEPVH